MYEAELLQWHFRSATNTFSCTFEYVTNIHTPEVQPKKLLHNFPLKI